MDNQVIFGGQFNMQNNMRTVHVGIFHLGLNEIVYFQIPIRLKAQHGIIQNIIYIMADVRTDT